MGVAQVPFDAAWRLATWPAAVALVIAIRAFDLLMVGQQAGDRLGSNDHMTVATVANLKCLSRPFGPGSPTLELPSLKIYSHG